MVKGDGDAEGDGEYQFALVAEGAGQNGGDGGDFGRHAGVAVPGCDKIADGDQETQRKNDADEHPGGPE